MRPSIVILTGAGISAESGLPTFRAVDGLWENHRIQEVATPEGFGRAPALVNRFYNERRTALLEPSIQPNEAHLALTKLQCQYEGDVMLVTQNIDDLHERAGSTPVHMHGELLKARCSESCRVFDWTTEILESTRCECCDLTSTLRPHVVWFGEEPLSMNQITTALSTADIFIAIGTSGQVYPAAGFVQLANDAGAETIEFNLEESSSSSHFQRKIQGAASVTVPEWVEKRLAHIV